MEDYEEIASTRLGQPPTLRRCGRRWLLIGGFAFAFMFALGVGAIMVSSIGTTQAASATSGNDNSAPVVSQGGDNSVQGQAATPVARGQCEALTVSSVNGNTIVAKTSSGSSVTIHTTASTQYTQAGKTAAASAIKVGTRINVMGTHNSDRSITATSIDIG